MLLRRVYMMGAIIAFVLVCRLLVIVRGESPGAHLHHRLRHPCSTVPVLDVKRRRSSRLERQVMTKEARCTIITFAVHLTPLCAAPAQGEVVAAPVGAASGGPGRIPAAAAKDF